MAEDTTPQDANVEPVEPVAPVMPEGEPATATATLRAPATPDVGGFIWGTGRRKSAVARVRIRPAKGDKAVFRINGRDLTVYFSEERDHESIRNPLKVTQTEDKLDIFVNAHGGGYTGQAGAVVLGISRALCAYDPALEPILREHGLMTRDPREVERKKPGQPGARRRFQFSKR